jgi:hypothetical protein
MPFLCFERHIRRVFENAGKTNRHGAAFCVLRETRQSGLERAACRSAKRTAVAQQARRERGTFRFVPDPAACFKDSELRELIGKLATGIFALFSAT